MQEELEKSLRNDCGVCEGSARIFTWHGEVAALCRNVRLLLKHDPFLLLTFLATQSGGYRHKI